MFKASFDPIERAAEMRALCDHMIGVVRIQGPGWLSPVRDKAAVERSLEHVVSRLRAIRDGVPVESLGTMAEEDGDDGDDIEEADLEDTKDLYELAKRSLDAFREDLRRLRETWERRLVRTVDREAKEAQLREEESYFLESIERRVREMAEYRRILDSPPGSWFWVRKHASHVG